MNFIGSKLFIHVYSRWREEFVQKKSTSFRYRSIILATNVCQLSRVREETLHGCNTIGNVLWKKINNVFTMDTTFYQQVDHSKQEYFLKLLTNIRRVGSLLYDWDILMSQVVTGFLEHKEIYLIQQLILFQLIIWSPYIIDTWWNPQILQLHDVLLRKKDVRKLLMVS